MLYAVERFGAQSVFGRVLSAGEIQRMMTVERIVQGYKAKNASPDWAKWAEEHPELDALLNIAMRLSNGE